MLFKRNRNRKVVSIREIDLDLFRQQIGKEVIVVNGKKMIRGWIHWVDVYFEKVEIWISGRKNSFSKEKNIFFIFK